MTAVKNNRGKWSVDITFEHADGRVTRVRKTSPRQTKTAAERLEREIRQALDDGSWFERQEEEEPETPTLTVSDFKDTFLAWCVSERHKPSGISTKVSCLNHHIIPFFGARALKSFSQLDEVKLKERFAEKARSTYNNSATTLNRLLKVAVELKQLEAVPHKFKLFKRSDERPGFWDFDELEWLVAAAARLDPRIELACLLGAEAGLRRGEIIALERQYCDLRRGLITVAKSQVIVRDLKTGKWLPVTTETKGLDYRVVPMTTRLLQRLKAFDHLRGPRILYPDPPHKTITPKIFKQWMAAAQRLARLNDKGETHILRHTFCSHLAMRGAHVRSIQTLAGHRQLSTTLKYMHLSQGETHRAIALLNDRTEPGEAQVGLRQPDANTGERPSNQA
jgi:integrase